MKPILRWAGGKRWLMQHLVKHLPLAVEDLRKEYYVEPFLGSGAMFFYVKPEDALVNDINPGLMACYKAIRNRPQKLYARYEELCIGMKSQKYYDERDRYNSIPLKDGVEIAALFLFINTYCFNGIYRENRRGEFNVPYGKDRFRFRPSQAAILEAGAVLRKAKIVNLPYGEVLARARANSFIFLDPPYPPASDTAFFNHYNKDRFTMEDQAHLAQCARKLHEKGHRILLTNGDSSEIRCLYDKRIFKLHSVEVPRWVSCKKVKGYQRELIIKNY